MCIYMISLSLYVYTYICIHMCIYIYIERERGRDIRSGVGRVHGLGPHGERAEPPVPPHTGQELVRPRPQHRRGAELVLYMCVYNIYIYIYI